MRRARTCSNLPTIGQVAAAHNRRRGVWLECAMLQLVDLTVQIAATRVCERLSLHVRAGQRWGMLGANGVGKTTLLHTLAGLRAPLAGQVLLGGQPLVGIGARARARQIGVLFQGGDDPFPASVEETALIGRHPHLPALARESDEDRRIAREALAVVDLGALAGRSVTTLSGGERQRLAIATLLTQAPRLWLLDEPTNHLDLRHQITLLEHLTARIVDEGGALLMTLHEVNLAARFCDHLLLLFGTGETLAGPADEILDAANLERLYGHPVRTLSDARGRVYVPG